MEDRAEVIVPMANIRKDGPTGTFQEAVGELGCWAPQPHASPPGCANG